MTILFMQICDELNYVPSSPLNWIITVVSSFDSDMHKEFNNVVFFIIYCAPTMHKKVYMKDDYFISTLMPFDCNTKLGFVGS